MTTVKAKLLGLLDANGIAGPDAEEILTRYTTSELGQTMANRMHDSVDGYPPQLWPGVWMAVCATTVEWMKAEHPRHWARALFEDLLGGAK